MQVRIEVIGPLRLLVDGVEASTGSTQLRRMLACMVLHGAERLGSGVLREAVWPEGPPPSADRILANHAGRLRRLLGDPAAVGWHGSGYELDPSSYADDRREFDALAALSLRRVAAGEHADALGDARRALGLWRGTPWSDLDDLDAARFDRERLGEVRAAVQDAEAEALLGTGRWEESAALLAELTAADPFRERRWWLRALALHRARQRRRSLQVLQEARTRLGEVGLQPGPDLTELEDAVARDDPHLLVQQRQHTSAPEPAPDGADRTGGPGDPGGTGGTMSPPPQQAPANGQPLFVGREEQLTALASLARPGSTDRDQALVLVEGEAGIGKTWLLTELGRRLERSGTAVLRMRCSRDPTGPNRTLSTALDDWVRTADPAMLVQVAGPLTPELCRVSAALAVALDDLGPPPPGRAEERRHRLLAAFADLLARLAELGPTVLVVDDLHWARPDTAGLLRHGVGQATGATVVGALRTGAERNAPVERWLSELATAGTLVRVPLDGLSEAEVSQLVELRTGRAASAPFVESLWGSTGGNPFYVRELLEHRLSTDEGAAAAVSADSEDDEPSAPRSIAEVVNARVDELPLGTRDALEAMAVAGATTPLAALELVVPGSLSALTVAEQAALVRFDAATRSVTFRHDIIRQAVRRRLAPLQRMSLHDRIGTALHAADPDRWAAAVAQHFVACEALDPSRALEALRHAASVEVEGNELSTAAEHLARARRLAAEHGLGGDALQCELLIAEGDARRRLGDTTHQELLLEAMSIARERGDDLSFARAVLCYCRTGPTSAAGVYDAVGAALAEEALATLPEADSELRARLLGAASMLHSVTPDKSHSRDLYWQADAMSRRLGDPSVMAEVLANSYWTVDTLALMDRRDQIAQDLITLGHDDSQADFEGHRIRFSVRLMRSRPVEADLCQDRMVELLARVPEPANRCVVGYQRATLEVLRGRLGDAEGTIAQLARDCDDAGLPESRTLAVLGGLQFALLHPLGRLHELLALAEPLVEEQPGIPAWRAGLAVIHAQLGDHERVIEQADVLSAHGFAGFGEDFIWTGGMTALGLAVAATGDAARSGVVYERLRVAEGMTSWIGSGSFGPVDQALGDLSMTAGRIDGAEVHYRCAHRVASAWGAPAYTSWAEAGLARVCRARGDATTAEELLDRAERRADAAALPGVLQSVRTVRAGA